MQGSTHQEVRCMGGNKRKGNSTVYNSTGGGEEKKIILQKHNENKQQGLKCLSGRPS